MNPENFEGTPEYYNKQNTNKEKIQLLKIGSKFRFKRMNQN